MLAQPEPTPVAPGSETAAPVHVLMDRFPLPAGSEFPTLFTEAVPVLGSTIHLVGLSSSLGGETVFGSAAGPGTAPLDRAYFELLERLAVVRAIGSSSATFAARSASGRRICEVRHSELFGAPVGAHRRAARSNGVAVGRTWTSASQSARWELLERDHVLRSWYGDRVPVALDGEKSRGLLPSGVASAYDVQLHELGSEDAGVTVGLFLFPRGSAPLAYGFAARASVHDAVSAAASECVQRLGFLWGEEIPSRDPELAPSPDYHQEFYLVPKNHHALREWLHGEHVRYRGSVNAPSDAPLRRVPECVDLTPPELRGRLRVAKATDPARIPLVFGSGHPWLTRTPEAVLVHPIA